jgi:hypothetical protein
MMSFISHLSFHILLNLIIALPQIDLDLTDQIGDSENSIDSQHDCLHLAGWIERDGCVGVSHSPSPSHPHPHPHPTPYCRSLFIRHVNILGCCLSVLEVKKSVCVERYIYIQKKKICCLMKSQIITVVHNTWLLLLI